MNFITVTHSHYGHKIHIAINKINTIQRKYDSHTGEAKTLITYGESGGNYVAEDEYEVLSMINELEEDADHADK
jgi:hypothetical protein